jgi:hypothetical protein
VTIYRIRHWNELFENNRSRGLKRMDWVPMPNRMDGDGYTELMDHANGTAHYGAWNAVVQIASRCDVRGTLVRDDGRPHDFHSLSRISRIPAAIFEEAIPRFIQLGWLDVISSETVTLQKSALIAQADAIERHGTDTSRARGNGTEGNGTEGMEGTEHGPAYWSERLYERHPKKKNLPLVQVEILRIWESRNGTAEALLAEIDRVHALWCGTDDWQKKSGSFAPPLDQWLVDRGFTREPDTW